MTLPEIVEKTTERLKTFKVEGVLPALRFAHHGTNDLEDILNTNGNAYYQWSSCLMEILKPKQVVELGGAMGVWDIMVLHTLPEDSQLWSITLYENGLEFSYIKDDYPNFHPVVGDDLDLTKWPKELDLATTDLWFIDTIHTYEQVKKELDLYTPFFKKGALILFDDIRMNEGMTKMWHELSYEKIELTNPLHYTGFGLACV